MALDGNGAVHTWGANADGKLGNNTTASALLPVNVSSFGSLSGKRVVAIAAGNDFSMALDSNGNVHLWGAGTSGELAQGNATQSNIPVIGTLAALSGKNIVSIAAGQNHCIACDANGTIICWGAGGFGQIGIGTTADSFNPVQISGVFGSLSNPQTTAPSTSITFTPFFVSFTGQHRVFVAGETTTSLGTKEGFIVVCDQEDYITTSGRAPYGKFTRGLNAITMNDTLPIVSVSRAAYDRRVFGVLSSTVFPLYPEMSLTEQQTQRLVEVGDIRMECNAIGAGAIRVCDAAGPLASGDLITSSGVPGYGMLQADAMPHVFQCFTVAKATCSCDFTAPQQPAYQIRVDADGLNVLDGATGGPLWVQGTSTVQVDSTGTVVTPQQQAQTQVQGLTSRTVPRTEPKYQRRFVRADGTQISQAEYDSVIALAQGSNTVHRAAFIGCTYHCG